MATAPLALHEIAMELIQAGFQPSQCKILQDKIKCMVQQTITSSVEKYRIPIKESIGGFVVPGKFLIPCLGRMLIPYSRPHWSPRGRPNLLSIFAAHDRRGDRNGLLRFARRSGGMPLVV